MTEVKKLAHAIDLIAKRIPGGILALLGQREAPTHEELKLALWKPRAGESISVTHDVQSDRLANEAITQVMNWEALDKVSWPSIVKAVKYYSTCPIHKRAWQLYAEYSVLCGLPRPYGTGALSDLLSDKYQVSSQTLYRVVKQVPVNIALLAISGLEFKPWN